VLDLEMLRGALLEELIFKSLHGLFFFFVFFFPFVRIVPPGMAVHKIQLLFNF